MPEINVLEEISNKSTQSKELQTEGRKTGKQLLAGPVKYPDPKKHQQISFAKSILRIMGYVLLYISFPTAIVATAAGVLIASEALGIYEELV